MSETVKVIVTLSKGQYEALKDVQFGGIGSRMIFNAVKNGIPLDDVKAEIENDACGYRCDEFVDGINHVLEIIDSIGKGDKE